jgi:hypothetical protein
VSYILKLKLGDPDYFNYLPKQLMDNADWELHNGSTTPYFSKIFNDYFNLNLENKDKPNLVKQQIILIGKGPIVSPYNGNREDLSRFDAIVSNNLFSTKQEISEEYYNILGSHNSLYSSDIYNFYHKEIKLEPALIYSSIQINFLSLFLKRLITYKIKKLDSSLSLDNILTILKRMNVSLISKLDVHLTKTLDNKDIKSPETLKNLNKLFGIHYDIGYDKKENFDKYLNLIKLK